MQQDTWHLFESVYVSAEIAAAIMRQFSRHTGTVPLSRTLRQKAWLRAALFAIQEYREQDGADQARLALQAKRLRVVSSQQFLTYIRFPTLSGSAVGLTSWQKGRSRRSVLLRVKTQQS